ncbi:MAG: sugar ABC transporter permease [Acidimicrobiia bacterium]|nr:sugar ABC transporter permease [bacterium]MXW57815.1 sugar ABC transporter permease [Acidimicrobiia bacterium]MXZ77711.1 sugar ABC transporter permease [Acidimicrobiia bacterium]MYB09578.1 sugar ABC transporter permease [Acidimicrobiia bacterium]MYB75231.1 sugar ABC transporter permease [Acidimicrobiia bacterium]
MASTAASTRSERRTGLLMVAPAVALLLLFLATPFAASFYFSFTDQRLASPNPTSYVGVDQFDRLLSFEWVTLSPSVDENGDYVRNEDGGLVYPLRETIRNNPENPQFDGLQKWFSIPRGDDKRTYFLVGDLLFVKSMINTIFFAGVVVPVQSALGLVLALLVNQKLRGINIFRAIYFMPVVTAMVVISILWRFIYDAENGLLNSVLDWFTFGGITGTDWLGDTTSAMPAMMGMSIWQAVGLHMVIWLAGLQTIPGVLYEAASIDGASRWAQFRHVTWPGLRATRVFIIITITIAAFGLFTQVDVMTNGGPLDSTSSVIFYAVRQGWSQQNIAYGSAISLVFFIMVLAVALVQRWLTREPKPT